MFLTIFLKIYNKLAQQNDLFILCKFVWLRNHKKLEGLIVSEVA